MSADLKVTYSEGIIRSESRIQNPESRRREKAFFAGRAGRITVILLIAAVLLAGLPLSPAAAWTPLIRQVSPANGVSGGSQINPPATSGRVVVVTLDYLQIRDLESGLPPALSKLFKQGAIGLINVNTGGGLSPENTHATIGSGSHMVAAETSPGKRAEDLTGEAAAGEYRRRTGTSPPPGALVYLNIAKVEALNKKLHYTVVPGALGRAVREAGFKTAALGNSDGLAGPARPVMAMVMDHRGIVDAGAVGKGVVSPDDDFITGFSTDYKALLDRFTELPPEVRLVAIDLGDLGRLQGARDLMAREQWQAWRQKAIQRADQFLAGLINQIDAGRDLLVLVCPTPGDDGEKKDRLAPVFMYGAGVGSGLLYSPTTRRPGVIMNIDIAPTVLQYLNISAPAYLAGRPAGVIPGSFGAGALTGMYRALELTYEARPYLQKGYVLFQLILLAVSLGFIFLRKRGKEFLKPFFLAVMAVPLVYLLMPLLPPGGIIMMSVELVLLTAGLTFFAAMIQKRTGIDPFLLICLATAASIAADLAAGSPLQKASVLGYDPIVGARFYGLGNEFMGVLIGSSLVGSAALAAVLKNRPRLALAGIGLAYLFLIYLIGAPQLGTNVGGTIAAASAFLVVFLLISGIRLSWPLALGVTGAVALVLLALTFYDAGRPPQQQSHIGRTASLIASGGLDQVAGIISRKSEMNLRLIRYTIWSRVLLASLAMLALLFYRPAGVMEGIKNRHPYLFKGLVGVITASSVAFVFNDSGVVAAATTMIFGAPPLIYLVLDQLEA